MAVHINPNTFIIPAFFGLAYPYILLINIVIVMIWVALLKFEAFISVIIIAAGFNHLSNYIRPGKSHRDTKDTFKVLSYNLRLFNIYEGEGVNSESKILDFLKTQEADILCLQEFYVSGSVSQKDEMIKTSLGNKYDSHMKVIGSGNDKYYGIVTYSRYPIVRKGEVIHPRSSSLTIFSDIVVDKDTLRIFNNQLQSYRLKKMERSFLEEITSADNNETINEFRNLSVSLKKGFIIRAAQANSVKAHIDRSPYPVIVTGDFNDTPVSYSYRTIRKGLMDAFVNSGYGAGFTYKGNYPANRIDYILYDDTLESTNFEIYKVKYSDHYPVAAWFKRIY